MYKMNRVRMYSVLLFALVLQLTLAPHLSVGGVKPDLVTMCIVLFGIFLGPRAGIESGVFGGFAQDVFAADFFWVNAFLGAATGFFAGSVTSKLSKDSGGTCVLITAALTGVSMSLHYIVVSLISTYHALGFFEYFSTTVVPGSLATGFIAAVTLFYYPRFLTVKTGTDII